MRNQAQLLWYTHKKSLPACWGDTKLSFSPVAHLQCPNQIHGEILVFCLLRILQQPWIPAFGPLGYTPSAYGNFTCCHMLRAAWERG